MRLSVLISPEGGPRWTGPLAAAHAALLLQKPFFCLGTGKGLDPPFHGQSPGSVQTCSSSRWLSPSHMTLSAVGHAHVRGHQPSMCPRWRLFPAAAAAAQVAALPRHFTDAGPLVQRWSPAAVQPCSGGWPSPSNITSSAADHAWQRALQLWRWCLVDSATGRCKRCCALSEGKYWAVCPRIGPGSVHTCSSSGRLSPSKMTSSAGAQARGLVRQHFWCSLWDSAACCCRERFAFPAGRSSSAQQGLAILSRDKGAAAGS